MATLSEPSQYFLHLLLAYKMQRGGFIIENNSLSPQEWMDLGELKDVIEAKRGENQAMSMGAEMLKALAPRRRGGL